ncbi:16S rRNA (cytosine(1407)-C(5))-methyltransferase RsmF [Shewanella maritima]|uniref:Ribosomal RNA small subunit methyltransferase F n=1 Tax=Shewanella maritima TaxID=2520507 RepID=A0A411PM03_9GAMM|nr:16S rRNA (cytosine(1407)-C(5))-methyltransferase RsmF [Shewanella maritima]QBF84567.1 16S rRNA (cytosine(1407)-C(5))-methyltransferase RsmF [Shewanella maritima]
MANINPNFIKHIEQELPEHLNIDDLIEYCQRPLRKSIRVNTLKISVDEFKQLMHPHGWQFEPIPWCDSGFWITVEDDANLGNLVEHLQGLFYIQEASSMLPPTALFSACDNDDFSDHYVLDVASAPGSKSTQLAALMNNQGLLVANEYSSSRVKVLHANVQRMGVSNCALTHFDGRVFGEYMYEQFDAILLDAPCGGEGTVRKDANALKSWDISDVEAIGDTQQDLIESAFLALKPGGSLVYSTCTLSRAENQAVCHHLKQVFGEAVEFESLANLFEDADKATTEEGFLHVWPQIYDSEGFFVAKINKLTSVERAKKQPKPQRKFPFSDISSKQLSQLQVYLDNIGLSIPEHFNAKVRDEEIWLFPQAFDEFVGKMRFQRIGFKLADILKKGFKIRHEAVIALTTVDTNNQIDTQHRFELTPEQAKLFLMGRDIQVSELNDAQQTKLASYNNGELIVTLHQVTLGVMKFLGHRLKNGLPRDLVHDRVYHY